ncbi:hypothetical protein K4L44_05960 [Halosquirtibacter laminarini]|uniref:Uncharacterized protein n=1 Tax=Halosquirtibacter laminarini TaxID=3374600 RepID=A0AC61NP03_9BACT|nr:hypothetical protein K4L44_05960 [Prolixibacteraceae bacterium]
MNLQKKNSFEDFPPLSGNELKEKIKASGVKLIHIAEKLGLSQQGLNQRFKAQKVKKGFILELMEVMKVDLSFFFDDQNEIKHKQSGLLKRINIYLSWLKFQEVVETNLDLGQKIGFTKNYVDQVLNGQIDITELFVDALLSLDDGVRKDWLWNGNGKMFLETPVLTHEGEYTITQIPFIPVSARAGFVENTCQYSELTTFPVYMQKSEKIDDYLVVEIDGDSMEPTLLPKTKVLIKQIPPENWGFTVGVVVVCFSDMIVVKRITENKLQTTGFLTLRSDNVAGGMMELMDTDIISMFRVIRIVDAEVR